MGKSSYPPSSRGLILPWGVDKPIARYSVNMSLFIQIDLTYTIMYMNMFPFAHRQITIPPLLQAMQY